MTLVSANPATDVECTGEMNMEDWKRKKIKKRDDAITIVCIALLTGGIFGWAITGGWWIFLIAFGLMVYLWNQRDQV